MKLDYPVIILVEGCDYVGKTTILKELAKNGLRDIENEIVYFREPGGSQFSEQVRELIMNNPDVCDETRSLMFTTSRLECFKKEIEPMMKENKIILLDRSLISTLVYEQCFAYTMAISEPILDIIHSNNSLCIFTLLTADIDLLERRRQERGIQNYFDRYNLKDIQERYSKIKFLINQSNIYIWDYAIRIHVEDNLESNVFYTTESIYNTIKDYNSEGVI